MLGPTCIHRGCCEVTAEIKALFWTNSVIGSMTQWQHMRQPLLSQTHKEQLQASPHSSRDKTSPAVLVGQQRSQGTGALPRVSWHCLFTAYANMW